MSDYVPLPASAYFRLEFTGPDGAADNAFQEAAGLSVELEAEEVREGGQKMYKHQLPPEAKYGNLILRRGFMSQNARLATWCTATTGSDFAQPLQTHDLLLHLLDANGDALATWTFLDAYPVKWSLSELNAQENTLAIETLELAYAMFRRA